MDLAEKKLFEYCESMLFDFKISDKSLFLNNLVYGILPLDTYPFEINSNNDLYFSFEKSDELNGFVYYFGGRWYLQTSEKQVDLKELKYIGDVKKEDETEFFLGIHSGYEMMNGVGLYESWIEKAKFLKCKSLAICETHSLSGVLDFQSKCLQNDIKPIIGMSVNLKEDISLKLYAKNFQGWQTLLKVNTYINVKGNQINLNYLKTICSDVYVVVDPKSTDFKIIDLIKENLNIDFYQLDCANFLNEEKDIWHINNFEKFLQSDLEPILIQDAFYLEQSMYLSRECLWKINKAFDTKTDNQYFKSSNQFKKEFLGMFNEANDFCYNILSKAYNNALELIKGCNFVYDTNTRHLPKYKMTKEESLLYKDNASMFIDLIKKGLVEKKLNKKQAYIDRLKKEIDVLKKGDVIDYFLSLYDIVKFAKNNDMLTGIARGSAGGSLVAYLLGIIQIDPMEFDLLFERFLNSGRMGVWEDRPAYKIETDNGNFIELQEGSLIRIQRDKKEQVIFIKDLKENDIILKY